ncbi:helix-turn-helix transcriptional regulator [Olivibacter sp. SDN3]|uniref:helix-turn-helix domain-containing protein n=1 Tax=Olivibacter sp. SDN3 TaxID=2764720 RepID=UPI001650F905|nr:AraC family transcriptional regulator [Olivibacter sp. SDN3]QNL51766.1 helix-turn-helix transcriptional regulator [Olivibacter sp. SDN3]
MGAKSFRSYYYSVFFFHQGDAEFSVGTNQYTIKKGSIATIGAGLPYKWINQRELIFDVVIFSEDIFKHTFDNFFYSLDYFCPDIFNVFDTEQAKYDELTVLLDTLKFFRLKPTPIPGVLQALLMLLHEAFVHRYKNYTRALTGKESFVATFRALLAKHFMNHKNVSFYASEMNITPKYLSEILLSETGWTAKKWIGYHLGVEAKTLLSYSKKPIKEVAYQLGYEDISHFTKAFKNWTGETPGEFRIQVY